MKAMDQTQLSVRQSEVLAAYEATQKQIAELEAKQANLKKVLYRYTVHKTALGTRTVPDYAPWLPFSL